MKPIKILTPLLMAFVLSVAAAPAVQAQGFENRTIFAFDAPVQVPGAVLPAGRYVFQLVNPELPTRAVEIRKEEGGQALVTTVTQETKRLEAEDAGGVTVTFVGTKGNYPPAIKSWFYPGDTTGHLFVYPEEQAKRIAEQTKQLVLSKGEGAEIFLMSESGERQPYGGEAQRAYLAEGQAPDVRAAGSGDMDQRIQEQLDRIEQLVQRGLAPQPEQGTVGTMGANKDQVMVAREDLRAIQQYVEHLRRDLASSREKQDRPAHHGKESMMSGMGQQQPHAQQQQPQQAQSQQQAPVGTSGAMTTVEEVMDNAERFYNQTVTVSGEVNEIFGKKSFNIQEEGVIDVDDNLLVLSNRPLPNLTGDSKVTVTGKVRAFVKADLQRDYDIDDWYGLDYGLDEDFIVTYDRRPVLIADSIQVRQPSAAK